jgi:hypothetical protein
MRDNDVFRALLPILTAGVTAAGLEGVKVKQANQPVAIAADTGPTLYLSKLFDVPVGHPGRVDIVDPDGGPFDMLHIETQAVLTTFQATAVFPQTPEDTTGWTASDLANVARGVMASDAARLALKAADGGGGAVLAPGQVRNPYDLNGGDHYEAFPSFDFVLSHTHTLTTAQPAIVGTPELRVSRV